MPALKITFFTTFIFALLFAITAEAHIRVLSPLTRSGNNDGTKQNLPGDPPCAGETPQTPLELIAGDQLNINFQETILHAGRFIIQFSATGENDLIDSRVNTSQDLLRKENEANPGDVTNYNESITVPDVSCQDCVIRVIQVMDDSPNQLYVHCLDINISGGTGNANNSGDALVDEDKGFKGACGSINLNDSSSGSGSSLLLRNILLMMLMIIMPLMMNAFYRKPNKIKSSESY